MLNVATPRHASDCRLTGLKPSAALTQVALFVGARGGGPPLRAPCCRRPRVRPSTRGPSLASVVVLLWRTLYAWRLFFTLASMRAARGARPNTPRAGQVPPALSLRTCTRIATPVLPAMFLHTPGQGIFPWGHGHLLYKKIVGPSSGWYKPDSKWPFFLKVRSTSEMACSLRNKRPDLSGRPPCKGVAIGVARRGGCQSGQIVTFCDVS